MSARKQILVVDDEPQVCQAVKMLLEFDGHTVTTAALGQEALDLLSSGQFDLVTTDYAMPGMNGDELAAAIKSRLPDQPVIMITAHAEILKTAARPLSAVDALVSKPFQLQDLRDAVQRATAP
jgi:CheY-like chemotaxis protein